VKAISLRQPWAYAVAALDKDIENRSWNTHYRGRVLLHASSVVTAGEWQDAVNIIGRVRKHRGLHAVEMPMAPSFECIVKGGIVGVARIARVLPRFGELQKRLPFRAGEPPIRLRPEDFTPEHIEAHGYHAPGHYGFVLADRRPTKFVPFAGMIGLFEVPEEVARAALKGV
jgi:ASCH domain